MSELWVWPAFLDAYCVLNMCTLLLKGTAVLNVRKEDTALNTWHQLYTLCFNPKLEMSFLSLGRDSPTISGVDPTQASLQELPAVGGVNLVEPLVGTHLSMSWRNLVHVNLEIMLKCQATLPLTIC